MSSGVPMRPSGTMARTNASPSGPCGASRRTPDGFGQVGPQACLDVIETIEAGVVVAVEVQERTRYHQSSIDLSDSIRSIVVAVVVVVVVLVVERPTTTEGYYRVVVAEVDYY